MRKVKYPELTENSVIDEAFLRKDLLKVAGKMAPIIAKKLGTKCTIPQMGYVFKDADLGGEFEGYDSYLGSGKDKIRINFTRGGSASVHSLTIFKNFNGSEPVKHIIIPPQFNIVQVMGHILYAIVNNYGDLGESYEADESHLNEAESHKQHIHNWMFAGGGNFSIIDEINKRGSDWQTLLTNYLEYLQEVGARVGMPALTTFQATCRKVLEAAGNDRSANNVPHVSVMRGGNAGVPVVDHQEEAIFEDELVSNEHIHKFTRMKFRFQQIIDGTFHDNGMYIYGRGGIGKSHWAKQMLVGQDGVFYTDEAMAGYTGLLQVLYNEKDKDVIILDDSISDADISNQKIQLILKSALESGKGERRIKVSKKDTIGGSGAAPPMSSPDAEDMLDFSDDSGVDSGEGIFNFVLKAKVIIITNYSKVPQSIQDRCEIIAMLFSELQVQEIIKAAMDKISPKDVPVEEKLKVMEWIQDRYKNTKYAMQPMSFRLFSRAVCTYVDNRNSPENVWQEWVFDLIRQQLGGKNF